MLDLKLNQKSRFEFIDDIATPGKDNYRENKQIINSNNKTDSHNTTINTFAISQTIIIKKIILLN